ncbi:hypothetical protein [Mangrovihabitans endophyticus]|uniref:Cell division initiation protein n=1 Tax=Mangrovihabitans endophyticus TaxID=1751298 RepID=A0A8J3FQD3_9ACTN|nr:hypothetical protein [Mangrovihabitans endophyticus]GGK99891.1 hypothetical protein GCM10012284_37880 [Mangrovihabitans endophyticus]
MTDNRMKDRVKVMFAATSPESETSEHSIVTPRTGNGGNPALPNQALQVLSMAQRTAEEHVVGAQKEADRIRTDAQAAAEQVARDAQVHAHQVRRDADKVLFDARAAAEQTAREARARTEEAQRNAEKIVVDARAQADAIVAEARASSEHLRIQAQQRYEDVVGSLGTKREGLQMQIEALERFDHEYRARLTSFMQGQLRALWMDQPQVGVQLDEQGGQPGDRDAQPGAPSVPPEDQRMQLGDRVEGPEEPPERQVAGGPVQHLELAARRGGRHGAAPRQREAAQQQAAEGLADEAAQQGENPEAQQNAADAPAEATAESDER